MKANLRRFLIEQFILIVIAFLLPGCANYAARAHRHKEFVNKEFAVIVTDEHDTLNSLAKRFLGDSSKDWVIADFNNIHRLKPGQEVIIPLSAHNPTGVFSNGYQTIPILCYHRFGLKKSRMVVTPENFSEQMAYLHDNGFRVISLSDLVAFVNGEKSVPKKSVVITMDDGYKSAYQYAFPILKKYEFPATIFVYSDFIGTTDGLSWKEMKEMVASGLVDIQPHSKSHSNLGIRKQTEDEHFYQQRIKTEITVPTHLFSKHLNTVMYAYAYPYGDTNQFVIKNLENHHYTLGATVQPGGNPSFAYPYMLRRNMVFGEEGIDAFKRNLKVFESVDLK